MNREQKIAHLVLHGYKAYEDDFGWVAIWSDEQAHGRMCKHFDEGANGPGWDVRETMSALAILNKREVLWEAITDDQLEHLTAAAPLPVFKHVPAAPPSEENGDYVYVV